VTIRPAFFVRLSDALASFAFSLWVVSGVFEIYATAYQTPVQQHQPSHIWMALVFIALGLVGYAAKIAAYFVKELDR
jgi:hypothetical protein